MKRHPVGNAVLNLFCTRCGHEFRCSYWHIAELCGLCAVAQAKAFDLRIPIVRAS